MTITPDDQCAHGDVRLIVDGIQLVGSAEDSRNITVSAAGVYLLRTLSSLRNVRASSA